MDKKEIYCTPPSTLKARMLTEEEIRLFLRAFGVPDTYRNPDGSYSHTVEFHDPADEFPAEIEPPA